MKSVSYSLKAQSECPSSLVFMVEGAVRLFAEDCFPLLLESLGTSDDPLGVNSRGQLLREVKLVGSSDRLVPLLFFLLLL